MKSLDFWQIIYKLEQKGHCYPFAKVWLNARCTEYFENSVICELVPRSTADFISVCSWRLKEKRQQGWTPVILKNEELTLERIEENDFDIAILTPFDSAHNTMLMSSSWHGKAWDDAISALRSFIEIPTELIGNAIYQNHFIARREIYQQYVSECLAPAISFMEGKAVFRTASGYREKKTRGGKLKDQELERLLQGFGLSDYPIGVFVLERLFRIWIDNKKYRIINL